MIAALIFAVLSNADPIALTGDYNFYSAEKVDDRPICSERWHFGNDGILTVESGKQIVKKRFRFENDGKLHELILVGVESNGLPDCTGSTKAILPGETDLNLLYRTALGDVAVCRPIYEQGTGKLFAQRGIGALHAADQNEPSDAKPKPN